MLTLARFEYCTNKEDIRSEPKMYVRDRNFFFDVNFPVFFRFFEGVRLIDIAENRRFDVILGLLRSRTRSRNSFRRGLLTWAMSCQKRNRIL